MNSGYLIFAALMMAGLDGIKNKIDPGAPSDKDLYDLPPEEEKNIPTVSYSLDAVTRGARQGSRVPQGRRRIQRRLIDAYIALKEQEVTRFSHDAASRRVRDVLQPLSRARIAVLSNQERGGVLKNPAAVGRERRSALSLEHA